MILKRIISSTNEIDEVNDIKSSIAEYMIHRKGFAPLGGVHITRLPALVEVFLNAKTTRQSDTVQLFVFRQSSLVTDETLQYF